MNRVSEWHILRINYVNYRQSDVCEYPSDRVSQEESMSITLIPDRVMCVYCQQINNEQSENELSDYLIESCV